MNSLASPSSAAGVPETPRTATDRPHASTAGDLFPGTTPADLVERGKRQPREFAHLNFEASGYTDETGRARPECLLTQDGFIMLAMGSTGREASHVEPLQSIGGAA